MAGHTKTERCKGCGRPFSPGGLKNHHRQSKQPYCRGLSPVPNGFSPSVEVAESPVPEERSQPEIGEASGDAEDTGRAPDPDAPTPPADGLSTGTTTPADFVPSVLAGGLQTTEVDPTARGDAEPPLTKHDLYTTPSLDILYWMDRQRGFKGTLSLWVDQCIHDYFARVHKVRPGLIDTETGEAIPQ